MAAAQEIYGIDTSVHVEETVDKAYHHGAPIASCCVIVDCHSSRPHKLRARKHNMWKLRWAGFNYDLISYLIQLFELLNFFILPILANE